MRLAIGFILILAAAALQGQSAPPTVTLDVIVDGGSGSSPLTAKDFTVADSDGPLTIDAVQGGPAPAADGEPLPPIKSTADEQAAAERASRIVGIFIDEYHLPSGDALASTREALASFVRRTLGPRDLVMVVRPLDSLISLRLTSDRESAAAAIEKVDGRFGDYTARSSFEQDFIAGAPARIDAARAQIALSTLQAVATHMGRLSHPRKTLIVVSGGFVPTSSVRRDQPLPGLEAVIRSATRGRVAIYGLHLRLPEADTAGSDRPDAVPPAALLERLANDTTGLMFEGGADASAGLDRIARDAAGYYALSVTPRPDAVDGRFRPVTVKVSRPGATVRARSGYTIVRDVPDITSMPRASSKPGLQVPRRSSPLIRPWFGLAPGEGTRTRVSFVWEAATGVPGERAMPTPARISMKVSTLEGEEVFAGASAAAGRDAGGALDGSARLSFEAPKGQLLVQMEIFDAAGRVVDRDVRDLVVGGFPAPLALGTPEVFRARTAREVRDLLENVDASPIVSRQFSRAEHLIVRVPIVNAGGPVDVTARLTSGFGAAMRELPVVRPEGTRRFAQVDFPLAGLASGSYAIQFLARGSTGTVVDRVAFSVRP